MARPRLMQVTGLCLLLAALAVCAGVRPLRVGAGGSADRLQAWYSDISDSVPPTLLTEDGLVTREVLEPGQALLRLPQAGWITAGGEDGCTAGMDRDQTGLASEEVLRLAQRLVLLRDDCSRHLTTQFCAYVGARACEFQYYNWADRETDHLPAAHSVTTAWWLYEAAISTPGALNSVTATLPAFGTCCSNNSGKPLR
jgi:hypothetical protein